MPENVLLLERWVRPADAQPGHPRLERGGFEPENPGRSTGPADAPAGLLEHAQDVGPLHILDLAARGTRGSDSGMGKVDPQRRTGREDHRTLDHVPQLPDVAGPGVAEQGVHTRLG